MIVLIGIENGNLPRTKVDNDSIFGMINTTNGKSTRGIFLVLYLFNFSFLTQ